MYQWDIQKKESPFQELSFRELNRITKKEF